MNIKGIIHAAMTTTGKVVIAVTFGAAFGLAAGSVLIWSVDRL